jgi:hypothetical protein
MLVLALTLLILAVLLGTLLAAVAVGAGRRLPFGRPLGALHGLLGLSGLGALLLALRGPPRGVALGVGSFGRIAAVLLALALLAGLTILTAHLRHRRPPVLLIGVHATIAVSGVVILAAYTLVG